MSMCVQMVDYCTINMVTLLQPKELDNVQYDPGIGDVSAKWSSQQNKMGKWGMMEQLYQIDVVERHFYMMLILVFVWNCTWSFIMHISYLISFMIGDIFRHIYTPIETSIYIYIYCMINRLITALLTWLLLILPKEFDTNLVKWTGVGKALRSNVQ